MRKRSVELCVIEPHDSVERFSQYGVEVIRADARFLAPRVVRDGDLELHAHRVVVATGSEPAVPSLAGLENLPFLTNETIFDFKILPRHLLVLGGGPLGIEMAQAYRRLGRRSRSSSDTRCCRRTIPRWPP